MIAVGSMPWWGQGLGLNFLTDYPLSFWIPALSRSARNRAVPFLTRVFKEPRYHGDDV